MANLTPAQQAQVDDVVGSMMATLYGYIDLIRQRPDNDYVPEIVRELADTTEGLAILDDDQSLPQNGIHSAYIAAQRELLDVNFKKVIPKGEAK